MAAKRSNIPQPKPSRIVYALNGYDWELVARDHAEDYEATRDAKNATPEEIAKFADEELEHDNVHGLVGAHTGLWTWLQSYVGPDKAAVMLRDLVERGGIRTLSHLRVKR